MTSSMTTFHMHTLISVLFCFVLFHPLTSNLLNLFPSPVFTWHCSYPPACYPLFILCNDKREGQLPESYEWGWIKLPPGQCGGSVIITRVLCQNNILPLSQRNLQTYMCSILFILQQNSLLCIINKSLYVPNTHLNCEWYTGYWFREYYE